MIYVVNIACNTSTINTRISAQDKDMKLLLNNSSIPVSGQNKLIRVLFSPQLNLKSAKKLATRLKIFLCIGVLSFKDSFREKIKA